MTITIDTNDVMTIQSVGMRALKKALGAEGTKVFLRQNARRAGDYTKEKYEIPEPSLDEIVEEMRKLDKDEIDRAEGKI
ncbi:MAG: hypothetical protein LBI42_01065 [Chitinispirillales bacterium]|jgi:nitrogenase molybdenum-iron protein alpha/beta subunit|nr:hypothetical protein [Chitinispirillales bacterium]